MVRTKRLGAARLRARTSGAGLAVLLLGVLACSGRSSTRATPSPPSTDDGSSVQRGERLRPVFVESPSGLSAFLYFRDTELDLDCNFAATGADTGRCLPDGPTTERVRELVYTDPACSEPHVALFSRDSIGPESCSSGRFAALGGDCGTPPAVFEIGPESSATIRYRIVDGVCTESSESVDALTDLFAVTPMPLDRFQAGRLNAGEPSGGIVPVDWVSDDGARLRHGFRDAADGFDCALSGTDDDDARCVPTELGLVGYLYADATCTEPAAMVLDCPERQAELPFARSTSLDTYFEGGPRLSESYSGSPDSCVQATGSSAFAVGSPVSVERFAPGRRVVEIRDGLTTKSDAVGAASLPPRTLASEKFGYECFAALGSDGELRCMPPPERYLEEFYADPACTERVEHTRSEILAVQSPDTCPPVVRVYARGAAYAGPVYTLTDGACTLTHDQPPDESGRTPHYVFGTELEAESFTALFERVGD